MPSTADFAIYTILHPDKLASMAALGQPSQERAAKRWVTAKKLFDEANQAGEAVAIIYADAANDCSRLIYTGRLLSIEVDAGGTSYKVADLVPIDGHRSQELVLLSSGENIAEGFRRDYALVSAPNFVTAPKTAAHAGGGADAIGRINHEARAGSAWPLLTTAAKERRTLSYGELARGIGIHPRALSFTLGRIQTFCVTQRLPPLTAIVMHGSGDRLSGRGFTAWSIDALDEVLNEVFSYDWSSLENPFHYALEGHTVLELSNAILERAIVPRDVYRLVKSRGVRNMSTTMRQSDS